ncbi:MAG: hypothetical protein K1X57_05280 [Gemmataceae bacterium]|nr:hypothetical protein [Gemmataceae bacterium]
MKRRLLCLLTLESRIVPAAPTSWSPRGSGGGGALYSPSIGWTNSSEYTIASDMSQLFRSTNAGAQWSEVNHTEIQGNHYAKVNFTNDPLIRFCLDYTVVGGLDLIRPSKSTDGGATWTPLVADPTGGGAFNLFADPQNPSRLIVSDYTTVWLSTDGGASFVQKFSTADTNTGLHLAGAFFDGSNIYVGTNKGLYVSANGGSSFVLSTATGIPVGQAIVSFSAGKSAGVARFFAVTATAGNVYAGITGADNFEYIGVYTLTAGAAAWTASMTGVSPGTYPFFAASAVNDANVAYLAGGSDAGAPVVYRTGNGGASWTAVFNTTGNQNINTGWQGAGGDRGWSYGEYALGLAVAPQDGTRAIITDLGGAHATTNSGATWNALYVQPADLNPAGSNITPGDAYHSSGLDNTTSWSLTWANQSTMILGNSDVRGQRSTDGGQSFGFGYTGHTLNSMYRSFLHTNGNLYAATSSVHDMYQSTYLQDSRIDGGDGEVRFSTDGGANWQMLHDFNKPVVWVAPDPTNANRLYASVVHSTVGGIYVSNNINLGGASTWTKLANPPRSEGHPFNIVVLNDGGSPTIVASYSGRRNAAGTFTASSGVFVSTDGGATWADRSAAGMRYWTKDIVIDPADATRSTWYAGVFSGWGGPPNGLGGLYKTTDRGVNWTRINSLDRVTSLTIDPTNTDQAYLTTETDGLWYTTNLHAGSPTFARVDSYPFRQPERVFFNPYNAAEVWVTSFGGGLMVGSTSPTPTGTQVNDGSTQRSRVTSLAVSFGSAVTLPANAFTITGPSGSVAYTQIVSGATATLTFASLADGLYTLNMPATGYSFGFHRLFGDSDGNRTVDAADLLAFRLAFLGTSATFDFDGDGQVGANDFLAFRLRFLTSV